MREVLWEWKYDSEKEESGGSLTEAWVSPVSYSCSTSMVFHLSPVLKLTIPIPPPPPPPVRHGGGPSQRLLLSSVSHLLWSEPVWISLKTQSYKWKNGLLHEGWWNRRTVTQRPPFMANWFGNFYFLWNLFQLKVENLFVVYHLDWVSWLAPSALSLNLLQFVLHDALSSFSKSALSYFFLTILLFHFLLWMSILVSPLEQTVLSFKYLLSCSMTSYHCKLVSMHLYFV